MSFSVSKPSIKGSLIFTRKIDLELVDELERRGFRLVHEGGFTEAIHQDGMERQDGINVYGPKFQDFLYRLIPLVFAGSLVVKFDDGWVERYTYYKADCTRSSMFAVWGSELAWPSVSELEYMNQRLAEVAEREKRQAESQGKLTDEPAV